MTDVFDRKKRSEIMSKVRSKNTTPELIVRKFLHNAGFRFRLHDKTLPGTPDIKLVKYKTIIQINGCFWHGHKACKAKTRPSTNYEFWKAKIEKNAERDKRNNKLLTSFGWRVIIIWECELRTSKRLLTFNDLLCKIRKE